MLAGGNRLPCTSAASAPPAPQAQPVQSA